MSENVSQSQRGKPRVTLTIRARLLISFLAVALLVSIIRTGTSLIVQNQVSRDNAIRSLATIAALKDTEINLWLNLLKTNLTSELNNYVFRNYAASILANYSPLNQLQPVLQDKPGFLAASFKSIIDQNLIFEDLILFDLQGNIFVTTKVNPTNITQIHDEWNYIAQGNSAFHTSPLVLGKRASSSEPISLIMSIPIPDAGGKPIGILAGRANILKLTDILANRTGLGVTGQTYLVDGSGTLIAHSNLGNDPALLGKKLTPQDFTDAQKLGTGTGQYTNNGGRQVLRAFQWNPNLQAFIFIDQDLSEALAAPTEPLIINLAAAVFALLMAILASFLVTRSIISPLNSLIQVSQLVAGGNLEIRATNLRQDEIGILGQTFNEMTDQLRSSIIDLEKKVSERTEELKHRSVQIQVASEIARDAAQAPNLNDLLDRAVNLIRDKFGFYHAGIFLIDEPSEFAVLKAATGEAGRALLARNHKLQVGESGMVGITAGNGQPRIANDVEADNSHFKNPLLPLTRSELAIPLKIGNHIIGVLDVQSTEISAFNQDDVNTLQTMADQLAVAFEKTRLLEQYQENLEQLTATYRQYTQRSWSDFIAQSRKAYSYRYKNSKVESDDARAPEGVQALLLNSTIKNEYKQGDIESPDSSSLLAVPIRIRGQNLGALCVKFQSQQINSNSSKLIENIADRLAFALENARLLEQIQRQAEQDHVVSDITTRIRSSNDIDQILKTAIQDLGRTLGVSKAFIQLRESDLENKSLHKIEHHLPELTGPVHKEVV